MQGLLDTFVATKDDDSKDATAAGEKLATQAQRLEASDVVWQYLFRVPAQATLQDEGRRRLTAPASVFVENAELYSARSMTAIWQRVHGASTGGTPSGVHGTAREVVVQPAGTRSSRPTPRRRSRPRPIWRSTSGQEQRREPGGRVEVTLTIPKQHDPDREDGDDRPDRPRRDEDGHLQGLPRGAVRREDVRPGERETGSR